MTCPVPIDFTTPACFSMIVVMNHMYVYMTNLDINRNKGMYNVPKCIRQLSSSTASCSDIGNVCALINQVLGVHKADHPHLYSTVHSECQSHGSGGTVPLHVHHRWLQTLWTQVK